MLERSDHTAADSGVKTWWYRGEIIILGINITNEACLDHKGPITTIRGLGVD